MCCNKNREWLDPCGSLFLNPEAGEQVRIQYSAFCDYKSLQGPSEQLLFWERQNVVSVPLSWGCRGECDCILTVFYTSFSFCHKQALELILIWEGHMQHFEDCFVQSYDSKKILNKSKTTKKSYWSFWFVNNSRALNIDLVILYIVLNTYCILLYTATHTDTVKTFPCHIHCFDSAILPSPTVYCGYWHHDVLMPKLPYIFIFATVKKTTKFPFSLSYIILN